jgi:hypothetical protein
MTKPDPRTDTTDAAASAPQARARPRRPPSDARRNASIANGRKGRGKHSEIGKSISALNSVSHGMTSNKLLFFDDELPDEFYDQVNRLARELGVVTECEYIQVEQTVYHLWKLRRIRSATAVVINKRIGHIRREFYERQHKVLHHLIGQLAVSPILVVRELKGITLGLKWLGAMLERFTGTLGLVGFLDVSQTRELIRVLGFDPRDLFTNRSVLQLQLDCLGARFGKGAITPAEAAELLAESRPQGMTPEEFQAHLEPYVALLPTREEARQYLVTAIDQMRDHLTEFTAVVQEREDRDIAKEVAGVKVDLTDPGDRRERYEAMADNGQHRSFRELRALQAARRQVTPDELDLFHELNNLEYDEQPPASTPDPPESAPAEPGEPAEPAGEKQNEAAVSQPAAEPQTCGGQAAQSEPPAPALEPGVSTPIEAITVEFPWSPVNHPLRE